MTAESVEDRDDYGPFSVICEDCEWANEPGLETTATWLKRKHERKTGHTVELQEPEGADHAE